MVVKKNLGDPLGIAIAGGYAKDGSGGTPIYISNVQVGGHMQTASPLVSTGHVVLSVNKSELLGVYHEKAVSELKKVKECEMVEIKLLNVDGTDQLGQMDNGTMYRPYWTYWLTLPNCCAMPKVLTLAFYPAQCASSNSAAVANQQSTASDGVSLGFCIVGGKTVRVVFLFLLALFLCFHFAWTDYQRKQSYSFSSGCEIHCA